MANITDTYDQYYAKDRATWRKWLEKNHAKCPGIWLVYYKTGSGKPRVAYADAVEEALCFGWIDSTAKTLDEERSMQLFTVRKPKSGWSKLNKDRIIKMVKEGLMTPAGQEKIDIAKKDGSWTKLDAVESLTIPPELKKVFATNKAVKKFFEQQSTSRKKLVLYWISNAKQAATKEKRIAAFIEAAKEGKLPNAIAI